MHGADFLLQVDNKCWMHASCTDWKGRGEVALWHSVPPFDDTKLIKELVPEAGFSHYSQRCRGRTSLRGKCGYKHDSDTAIYEDNRDLLESA